MTYRHRRCGRPLLLACSVLAALFVGASDQPRVRVEPTDSVGPRTLEKQTETAVVRDYLQAWHSLSGALEQNRADLLNADFVGTAKEKISDTIKEQAKLGIQTRYRRQSARRAIGLLLARRIIDPTSGHSRLRRTTHRPRKASDNPARSRALRCGLNSDRSAVEGARLPGRARMTGLFRTLGHTRVDIAGEQRALFFMKFRSLL